MTRETNEKPTHQSWVEYFQDLCSRFFLNIILAPLKSIFAIFYLEEIPIPNNEAGQLMRRALEPKSWFDKLSYGWVNKSIWIKVISITLVTLISGAVGLIFHMPLIMMGLVFFLSVGVHTLFVAHERNRIQGTVILAQQAVELDKDLEANNNQLKEVISAGNKLSDNLSSHAAVLMQINKDRSEETTQIQKHQQEYVTQVNNITQATVDIVAKGDEVKSQLIASTTGLEELNKKVVESKKVLDQMQESAVKFENSVNQFEETQKESFRLVQDFSIFVNQNQSNKPADSDESLFDFDWDKFNKDLDATGVLIKQMQQSTETKVSI